MNSDTTHLAIDYSHTDPSDTADPRAAMARAVQAAGAVIAELSAVTAPLPTPCAEWTALDVARHMIAVVDRAVAGATGQSVADMPVLADVQLSAVSDVFVESGRALDAAWADDASLATMVEVPWGEFPGAVVLAVYTADLLVHTWDLAVASACALNWPEGDVAASLAMASIAFPDESRDALPFDHVVTPAAGASTIEHLAGWVGRDVSRWRSAG